MKNAATTAGADWNVVRARRRGGADGRRLGNLLVLVGRAIPEVERRLAHADKPLLLSYPGLLARYGQLGVLERLQQSAGRPDGPPAVFVLLAADGQHQLPMIDGQALPVITSNQWMRVPDAWVQKGAEYPMIDGRQLLADLQPLRRRLEDDLRERSEQVPELGQRLREEWQAARQRERTAQTYEAWREDTLAQAAVMWLLACVFVRFLEDNGLLAPDPPRLAGPGARLQLARDQRTLYFQKHPHESDRDYLYSVFEAVAALPAAAPLFDHRHNPIWTIGISGDAATQVIDFWQRIDPDTGALVHDFTDPEWRTRFLGDLYQDLSESARKKYALLQTPDFVLQFILDRTLTPAIEEFGFREVRLIDPACGSGHFLLAAFERLFRLWSQHEPGRNPRELAQRALDQVSGVDLNPFAVAIARFRLLLAALRASNITRLVDAPAFAIDLAAGDSLLHGPRPGDQGRRQMYLDPATDPLGHVYATEDAEDLKRILGRRYHVVVGNPPYITPKDAALNKAYRDRFGSCHGLYALTVPFSSASSI